MFPWDESIPFLVRLPRFFMTWGTTSIFYDRHKNTTSMVDICTMFQAETFGFCELMVQVCFFCVINITVHLIIENHINYHHVCCVHVFRGSFGQVGICQVQYESWASESSSPWNVGRLLRQCGDNWNQRRKRGKVQHVRGRGGDIFIFLMRHFCNVYLKDTFSLMPEQTLLFFLAKDLTSLRVVISPLNRISDLSLCSV